MSVFISMLFRGLAFLFAVLATATLVPSCASESDLQEIQSNGGFWVPSAEGPFGIVRTLPIEAISFSEMDDAKLARLLPLLQRVPCNRLHFDGASGLTDASISALNTLTITQYLGIIRTGITPAGRGKLRIAQFRNPSTRPSR